MAKGVIVYFDGPDGVGKTTQLEMVRASLEKDGHTVYTTHTLGGSTFGDKLRGIFFGDDKRPAESDLYLALSIQHAHANDLFERRERGEIVLVDRSPLSIIAYQVFGEGLDKKKGYDAANELLDLIRPDLLLVYMAPETEMINRRDAANQSKARDHFEKQPQDFHRRVISGYAEAVKHFNSVVIDAQNTPEQVFADTIKQVRSVLGRAA